MKLNEGKIGGTYLVDSVMVDEAITRRLEALGVNEMTPVAILNKKGSGSVIFKVRGTRLAVGKRISENIFIREPSSDAAGETHERKEAGSRTGKGGGVHG
ncbi:MAG: ferrous iron transport protein A [Lachnospiraceae bacterium]|jgi:ferrous iron transport protein A|nr:ferrous iron transport protein A [Lachnospiraceae bacterium]